MSSYLAPVIGFSSGSASIVYIFGGKIKLPSSKKLAVGHQIVNILCALCIGLHKFIVSLEEMLPELFVILLKNWVLALRHHILFLPLYNSASLQIYLLV